MADDKLIFLDIDHVLTNTDLDDSSFLHFDPNRYHLSKINLKIFDQLLDKSKAKIIIASNWRRFIPPRNEWIYNGKAYSSPLPTFKKMYSRHIVGILPPIRHMSKKECLDIWFKDNCDRYSKKTSHYVILEDDVHEGYQDDPDYAKHLVMTDYHFGLTHDDAQKALEILKS